jgi:hypothetical protein
MTWRRRWSRIVLVAVIAAVPAAARAKRHGEAAGECQQRVASRIRADHPRSRGTSFDPEVQRTGSRQGALHLGGAGYVRTAKGAMRRFTYTCVVDRATRSVTRVRYTVR